MQLFERCGEKSLASFFRARLSINQFIPFPALVASSGFEFFSLSFTFSS
jgi:hypothetical protein